MGGAKGEVGAVWVRACAPETKRGFALALVLLAALATGCSVLLSARPVHAQPAAVTLTLWYTQDPASDEGFLLQQMVEEFESEHPNVTVNLVPQNFFTAHDTYKNAFAAGTQPDVFRSAEGDVTEWVYLQAVMDLTGYLSEEDKQDFLEVARYTPVFEYEGEEFWYAVPEVVDVLLLFYNKRLFEQAGIPEPPSFDDPEGWSWDDFRGVCEELAAFMRANDLGDYSFNIYKELQYSFNVFLWGFGGDYWAKDDDGNYALGPDNVTVGSTEAVQALEFLLGLKNDQDPNKRVMPEQNAASENDFKEGRVAMVLNGPWAVNSILKGSAFQNLHERLGVAAIPGLNSTDPTPRTPVGGHAYVVSHDCPHPDEAVALVRHLTSVDANVRRATELGLMPARKSAYNDSRVAESERASYFLPMYESYLPYAHVGHPLLVNWKAFAADQLANELRRAWTDSTYAAAEALASVQQTWEENDYLTLSGGETPHPVTYWHLVAAFVGLVVAMPVVSLVVGKLRHKRPWKEELKQFSTELRENKLAYAFVAGTMVVLAVEVFLPLLVTLDTSFRAYTPAAESKNPLTFHYPEYVGLSNYAEVFTRDLFFQVLFNTIFWTAACVALQVLIGLGVALLLRHNFPGRGFYLTLVILPWAVPSYVTVYVWRVFILQDSTLGQPGLFNMVLNALRLPEAKFLSADAAFWLPGLSAGGFTLFPVSHLLLSAIMVNVWLGVPFVVVSFTAGLANVPEDLYEAAKIEGASRWQQFRQITLPLLKPTFLVVTLLGVVWTFNMFNVIYILALNTNIPANSYSILAVWVYELAFHNFTKGAAAAVSWVIFFMLLTFSMIYKRTMKEEGPR
ncbi:MAG: hypothetical protein Kow0069_28050 [Promethearchaeota archaeon]